MTRKKPDKKTFANSPFKDLKGLSVSAADAKPDKAGSGAPSPPAKATGGDGPADFAREMEWLGVKPLPGRKHDQPVSPESVKATPANTSADEDAALFQEAVGQLARTFKDEWPEEEMPRATPRRMRQVERGQLVPEAELDLHGLGREEAVAKVGFFLEDCRYQGLKTVLIITGKGSRSPEGPVLRQAVERLLAECTELVVEWGAAPRRYGGAGALVVFLRKAG